MERILFIVPPHITFEAFIRPSYNARVVRKGTGSYGSLFTDMPLGVLSLSAYVKKHALVQTRLVDFNVVLNKLEEFQHRSFASLFEVFLSTQDFMTFAPTVVAISALFTPSYGSVVDIAQCCRNIFPSALVVAGGGVATNMYNELFADCTSLDSLCYGEGEKPLLGLLRAPDKRRYLEEHPSWITPRKAQSREPFHHDFIEDLDEIPFPDYGICATADYGLNPAITAYASIEEKAHNFHVMTSRGCPHRCCFCSSHTVHGRRMRYYTLDRVREDFTRLTRDYRAKTFVFQDDHFLADRRRALAIIQVVRDLQVTAVFQNGLALYALDKEILEALKGAGGDQLVLAVESGSTRVLKEIIHKPLSLSTISRVARDCRELGIYTNVNVLIGLPGETKNDIEEARVFLRTLDANWFIILCATPLVGSEMLEICLRKNYIKGNYVDCDYKSAVVETEDFTAEYIQEMAYILNLDLNFVNNADFRLGHYATALKGFENAIRAREDHAIAHHYAAQCYEKLGEPEKAQVHRSAAKAAAGTAFWRRYLEMFLISV